MSFPLAAAPEVFKASFQGAVAAVHSLTWKPGRAWGPPHPAVSASVVGPVASVSACGPRGHSPRVWASSAPLCPWRGQGRGIRCLKEPAASCSDGQMFCSCEHAAASCCLAASAGRGETTQPVPVPVPVLMAFSWGPPTPTPIGKQWPWGEMWGEGWGQGAPPFSASHVSREGR